jgi:hypothetical protein
MHLMGNKCDILGREILNRKGGEDLNIIKEGSGKGSRKNRGKRLKPKNFFLFKVERRGVL